MYREHASYAIVRLPARRHRRRLKGPKVFYAVLLAFIAVSVMQSSQIDRLIAETQNLRVEYSELRLEHKELLDRFEA